MNWPPQPTVEMATYPGWFELCIFLLAVALLLVSAYSIARDVRTCFRSYHPTTSRTATSDEAGLSTTRWQPRKGSVR